MSKFSFQTIKRAMYLLATVMAGLFFTTLSAWAQNSNTNSVVNTDLDINLGGASPIEVIISVINWSMGILALIAVIIIIVGGVIWMLSRGEEEKITQAKAFLRNGLIGLVIVLSAWGVAVYVLNLLLDFTDAQAGYDTPDDETRYGDDSPFYVDHTNPSDGDTEVTLCHIVAATFSFPLNEDSVTDDTFKVWIPSDATTNPDGGLGDGQTCSEGVQCKSGVCSDSNRCDGDQLAGSFDFSESSEAAVFYPVEDYYQNTKYQAELTTAVEGIDPETGAVYTLSSGDAKRIFTFTTGTETDEIPPKVDVVSVTPYPGDGDTEICLNPTLQASFSESLDPASPDDQNVWLYSDLVSGPSDALDVQNIHLTSIGGNDDDTIVTSPELELSTFTEYGLNLYSGNNDGSGTFPDAIYDTCGNPLSGDFDDEMEGSPIDDFVEPTSAGLDQAFCSCTTGVDTCSVDVGSDSCSVDADTTCVMDAACSSTHEDYLGYEYQWTFTTGDQPYCTPEIDTVSQEDYYYSEDEDPFDSAGSEDSGKVLITGDYLYPFYDVEFYHNVSAAGMNCFDADHYADTACFVGNSGSSSITLRTPVASQTGRVGVENGDGEDRSADVLTINSPFISYTSPSGGPVGQFVTIKGGNFVDYDPTDPASTRGQVWFDDIQAEIQCSDGWDDDEIIVSVPEGFAVGDAPNIQVITSTGYYSNDNTFSIEDGDPGPGICELSPSCSNDGSENVIAYGENFLDADSRNAAYFDPPESEYLTAEIATWNEYDATEDSLYIETNSTPVTDTDVYDFTAVNENGISNGLDYTITCSEPPELFTYNQCNIDNDVWYLPNPRPYEKNACRNASVMLAFTHDMTNLTVTDNVDIYKCNYGYEADEVTYKDFDDTTCSATSEAGTFSREFLSDAFLGEDGTGTLDGSSDIDGDGENEAYEGYRFTPSADLDDGYFYKVVVPISVQDTDNIPLAEEETWYFRVKNDGEDCVADLLSVSPYSQIENSYEYAEACLENYEYDSDGDAIEEPYTYRAIPATSDCQLLNDEGDYDWTIDEGDIVQFGDTASHSQGVADSSTIGFNSICLQGEETINSGDAVVTINYTNTDGSGVQDTAVVTVDFGYCTSDADCFTDQCTDTYCDLQTSHCAPDITSFTPNKSADSDTGNDTDPDVGPGGCITLNGCYFGSDRTAAESCTCTSVLDATECDVNLDNTGCLLPDRHNTCTLDESLCTLSSACSDATSSAVFASEADGGGLESCTCTSGTSTCDVDDGDTSCVIAGTSVCSSTSPTYVTPDEGAVYFTTTESDYPSVVYCEDTWDNDQVIAQVPTALTAAEYTLKLESHYYNELDAVYLSDTYDEETCVVGSDATPCLCTVDPEEGYELDTVELRGEGFTLLDPGSGNEKATFAGSTHRVDSEGTAETWTSDNQITGVEVPETAVTDDSDGVQLQNDTLDVQSNALGFEVQCASNYDCGTGCCNEGQCASAEVCNACESKSDCTSGACDSDCVDGMCAPYIIEVTPDSGAVGQPVTIQGCHFGAYYNPADGWSPLYSAVTVDDIEAELACSETESWNNQEIIATIPDGIFTDATDTTGSVVVRQVYNDGDSSQNSNTAIFTQDESCSEVDIPVLCGSSPEYSPYDTSTTAVKWSGDNFYGVTGDGYCTCSTDTLGDCSVDIGDDSCTVTQNTTYYVNEEDQSEPCSDGTTAYNGDVLAFTSNDTTLYDATPGDNFCTRYLNPDDLTDVCIINPGSTSCVDTNEETCYADPDYPTTAADCAATFSNFTSLDGGLDYYNTVTSNVDAASTDALYYTDVTTEAATGDAHAFATRSDGSQCVSNGLDFPITCSSCGDCSSGTALNCNLNFDTGVFGACTADTSGFCRTATDSCCNTTSCVYDSSTAEADDMGTCSEQPVVVFDDTDEDTGITSDAQTNPENDDTNVCPNSAFAVEFSIPITTELAFEANTDDDTTNDILNESLDFSGNVLLRPAATADTDLTTTELAEITLDSDTRTLTLTQGSLLDFDTEYEIILLGDDAIDSGDDHQGGIIDASNGVAAYCDTDQLTDGMCDVAGMVKLTFTTVTETNFEDMCGPSYVQLEATDDDFVDGGYIFSEEEQEEEFEALVYAAGEDQYPDDAETDFNADTLYDAEADNNSDGEPDGDDDQQIIRIADEMYWEYTWDPVYDSLEALEGADCPVAGIISDAANGTCSCELSETTEICSITKDNGDGIVDTTEVRCSTPSGLTCTTDSPNGICDEFDTGYDGDTGTCTCATSASCDIDAGEASCDITQDEGADVTCDDIDSPSGVCDTDDTNWEYGDFIEDQETQTVTSDGVEDSDTVTVDVIGDDTVDGWSDDDDQDVEVLFCPDTSYVVDYENSEYNFSWAYCRGDDPQSDDFLPKFDEAFSYDEADGEVTATYGSDANFVYEAVFRDETAQGNNPDANNNTIAIRVYKNDLDGNTGTIGDSVNPALWFLLNGTATEAGYEEAEIDGYNAVKVGDSYYIAATNLDETNVTLEPGALTPYIYVIAWSQDATQDTLDIIDALKDRIEFNNNTDLQAQCKTEKLKIVRDTQRVTDLGTIAYLLSSYYLNDSDGNEINDFPAVEAGSFINGLTGSIWPSWDAVLGNALGQSLPTDPTNEYYDWENNCPYDPPDIGAGEDPDSGSYYDEAGTCWDPIFQDYYGPTGSSLYQYQWQAGTCTTAVCSTTGIACSTDDDCNNFALYSSLEYDDATYTWQQVTSGSEYNPCSTYADGSTAVSENISDFSDLGCKTFNYAVDAEATTLDGDYDDNFE